MLSERLVRVGAVLLFLLLAGCNRQSPDELFAKGRQALQDGNVRGAVVYLKNALKEDPNFVAARFWLADAYLKTGRLEPAEAELDKVRRQNPRFEGLELKYAELHCQSSSSERALKELDAFHKEHAPTSESLHLLGRARAIAKDYAGAETALLMAVSADPKNSKARFHLAKVQKLQGKTDAARQTLEDLVTLTPDFAPAYEMLGDMAIRAGDTDGALKVFRRFVAAVPDNPSGHFFLGLLELERADYDSVRLAVDQLRRIDANGDLGFLLSGLLAYEQQNYDQAVRDLLGSLKVRGHTLAYHFLGLSYLKTGRLELALSQFQKVLDQNPQSGQARAMVALTLLRQKRYGDAIAEARKGIETGSGSGLLYNILGSALIASGKAEEGLAALDEGIRIDPRLAELHLKKGLFMVTGGQETEGEKELVRALDVDPGDLETRMVLGKFYLARQDYDRAEKVFREGLDGSRHDALYFNALAGVAFARGDGAAAEGFMVQAMKADEGFAPPYLNLARYQLARGDLDAAEATLRKLVSVNPEHPVALMDLGSLLESRGNLQESADIFRKAADAGVVRAFQALALQKIRGGDNQSAADLLARAPVKEAADLPALALLARLYLQLGQEPAAMEAFDRMEAIRPGSGLPARIRLLAGKGRHDEALGLIRSVQSREPESSYGYLLESRLLVSQGKIAEASTAIERGLSRARDVEPLLLERASLWLRQGEQEKALQAYRDAARQFPRSANALFALGSALDGMGEKAEALAVYNKAYQIDPEHIPTLNNLAYLLAGNYRDLDRALTCAVAACRKAPWNPAVLDTLGVVWLKRGDAEKATAALGRALRVAPDAPEIRYHMAEALISAGRPAEAGEILRKLVDSGGDYGRQASVLLQTVEKQM
ncbi:MAG: PEP-CTERM system TPR-repeat protein PrsT [Geothermobacteraceae bacterium]